MNTLRVALHIGFWLFVILLIGLFAKDHILDFGRSVIGSAPDLLP
ncbi:MAG: hypothetical protein OXR66_06045 [Candidatus Woesearchaeota archaeon]|nr:hypothetical protein [Candidatus Woesearchaeota archaeon]